MVSVSVREGGHAQNSRLFLPSVGCDIIVINKSGQKLPKCRSGKQVTSLASRFVRQSWHYILYSPMRMYQCKTVWANPCTFLKVSLLKVFIHKMEKIREEIWNAYGLYIFKSFNDTEQVLGKSCCSLVANMSWWFTWSKPCVFLLLCLDSQILHCNSKNVRPVLMTY